MHRDENEQGERDFEVFSASGKLIGYGTLDADGNCDVYELKPSGEELRGTVVGEVVEFTTGEIAGLIKFYHLLDPDKDLLGRYDNANLFLDDGTPAGTTSGHGDYATRAGAGLLLIHCNWFNADGSPNDAVR
ncbi:hypothetical protein [Aeoliella sp.]|uniref:hypothetical protein n=1 Tax=Aeoliella sp. TaxID=2795800 RepID=UPI003CCBD006